MFAQFRHSAGLVPAFSFGSASTTRSHFLR
jgi:hypothetical protein